jgi:hypothetical protein
MGTIPFIDTIAPAVDFELPPQPFEISGAFPH